MRIVLILAALAITARILDWKWLGCLIFLFLFGCAIFGVGEFIHDCFDGYSFSIRGQMRRAAARRTEDEDEAIADAFKKWRERKELAREHRRR